jgi:glycerol-3-phosphate dehydrogenase subunit C
MSALPVSTEHGPRPSDPLIAIDAIPVIQTMGAFAYLQNTPFTADHCLKCNVCTAACPVSAVTPLFPGPKTVGPQAQRFREPGLPSPDESLDYCSGCGICTLVCPHGVRVMEINTQAKALKVERDGLSLRNWMLAHNAWWGILGTPFAPILNFLFAFGPFRYALEKTMGMSRRAPFPKWAGYTFRGWFKRRPAPLAEQAADRPTVVYYHGCSTNTYEPRVGKLAVKVLEHNGFRVEVPDQGCCGLPMQSNGDFAGARACAEHNINALNRYAVEGVPIVGTAGSCIMALKSDYEHVLGLHDEKSRALASGVWDICEFLYHLHVEGKLKTDFKPIERAVPYHAPCQLKAHGMGRPALDVLDLIPGLRAVEMDAECCGIAGTYGYKVEKRQIAEDVGAHLVERIRDFNKGAGSNMVVCDTETCRWQIAGMTGAKVVHPIELIAQAYGITAD